MGASMLDRLTLTEARIAATAAGVAEIAEIPDPVGTVTERWSRPNGLELERVRTPLGVVGVIYESRPNVTADAGSLCLKAGNAVILRGGSDSFHSSRAIHAAMVEGLVSAGLPADAIQLVPTRDRAAVGEMLAGLGGAIDVIVPRGGRSLVERVQNEARVPVFAHLEGLVHIYVDHTAELAKALDIVRNAKLRRTSVCGAAETLLVERSAASTHMKPLVTMLLDAGCEVRGDAEVQAADARVTAGDRRRLGDGISRRHHRGPAGGWARGGHSITSRPMARTIPTPSSPRTRRRRRGSWRRSIRPSWCTTPRPSSPMAASSASAARSASPPGACTRGGRWGPSN